MHDKMKRRMIVDRLNRHTIDTKLNLMEQDMLIEPYQQWKQKYKECESYDISKPAPFDADLAFQMK